MDEMELKIDIQHNCYCGKPILPHKTYCSNKCIGNSPLIKLKKLRTSNKNYGTDHPMRSEEYRKQCSDKYFRKTGYYHSTQNPECKEKVKETCIKKYGVKHPNQIHISDDTLKKLNDPDWLKKQNHKLGKNSIEIAEELGDITSSNIRQYFKKYGIEIKRNKNKIKEKTISTYQRKYGVKHPNQIHISDDTLKKLNDPDWLKKQHYTLGKSISLITEELGDVGSNYICKYFHKYGIEIKRIKSEWDEKYIETCKRKYNRNNHAQIHISDDTLKKLNDPDWLKKQHYTLGKSISLITEELGDVVASTLRNYFHKYDIKIKSVFVSQGEKDLKEFISSIYDGEIITNTRAVISPLELDIYLPDLNIAFEYNGEYWHSEGHMKPVGYHRTKTSLCRTKGIKLYHIWERHWGNNQEKMKQTIINIIKSISTKEK